MKRPASAAMYIDADDEGSCEAPEDMGRGCLCLESVPCRLVPCAVAPWFRLALSLSIAAMPGCVDFASGLQQA